MARTVQYVKLVSVPELPTHRFDIPADHDIFWLCCDGQPGTDRMLKARIEMIRASPTQVLRFGNTPRRSNSVINEAPAENII